MELWDAYTRDGVKTGETLVRGEPVPAGRYHMVCEVLVRHTDGSYLCMARSAAKPNYPRFPEATAGGSALMGEDELACIRRELREETGIVCDDFIELGTNIRGDSIFHSYFCTVDWPKEAIVLQEGETEGYEWLPEARFIELVNSGRMIPEQFERMRGFYEEMGYLR